MVTAIHQALVILGSLNKVLGIGIAVTHVTDQVGVIGVELKCLLIGSDSLLGMVGILQCQTIVGVVAYLIAGTLGEHVGEERTSCLCGLGPLLKLNQVIKLHALHVEYLLIGGIELVDKAGGQVKRLLILLAEEQQLHIAHLVLGKVVGVLDVLAILLGSLGTQVVSIVLLCEFALNQCRVGHLGLQLLKTLDSHLGVHVEVGVGIFHIGLDVVGILVKSQLIDTGCVAPILLVGLGVGLEDVAVGIVGVPLAGVLDALLNILGIGGGISIIECARDFHL